MCVRRFCDSAYHLFKISLINEVLVTIGYFSGLLPTRCMLYEAENITLVRHFIK